MNADPLGNLTNFATGLAVCICRCSKLIGCNQMICESCLNRYNFMHLLEWLCDSTDMLKPTEHN